MTVETILTYVAPLLPAVPSSFDVWDKTEHHPKKRWGRMLFLISGLVVAWVLLWYAGKAKDAQIVHEREQAAAQSARADRFGAQLQDMNARSSAAAQSLQLLSKAIADPKLRAEAEAIHTELARGLSENLHTEDAITVKHSAARISLSADQNTVINVVALLLTAWFGLRSIFQSQDREALQLALRAYNQSLYNNLWRVGEIAERALKTDSLSEAHNFASGISEMSQGARHTLIAFSKEHTRFKPFYEPAWDPAPVGPEPAKSLVQKLFWL